VIIASNYVSERAEWQTAGRTRRPQSGIKTLPVKLRELLEALS